MPCRSVQSSHTVYVRAALLISGIEANPESPATTTTNGSSGTARQLKLGCSNIRSVVHKAAILHNLIHDYNIDILALSET